MWSELTRAANFAEMSEMNGMDEMKEKWISTESLWQESRTFPP